MPVFVVTHEARDPVATEGGTTFTFVTAGIESALAQARAAAGDRDISVAGGANIAQQYLKAGLLDEIQIHLVPVLLGGGVRLFDDPGPHRVELERTRVVESPGVTHLRFRVVR
jgi:dihydrofolate reductase